jgi:hypothetical protein
MDSILSNISDFLFNNSFTYTFSKSISPKIMICSKQNIFIVKVSIFQLFFKINLASFIPPHINVVNKTPSTNGFTIPHYFFC